MIAIANRSDDVLIIELAASVDRSRLVYQSAEDAGLPDSGLDPLLDEIWNTQLALLAAPAFTVQGILAKLKAAAAQFEVCENGFAEALRGNRDSLDALPFESKALVFVMHDLTRMLSVDPVSEELAREPENSRR